MDSSVALGAVLWLIGGACVAIQVAWTKSDKRKWAEEVEAAEREGREPPPEPMGWRRRPVDDLLERGGPSQP